MDVSPAAMVGAVVASQQASTAQEVQLAVMKKAMDMQGSGALSLLQPGLVDGRLSAGGRAVFAAIARAVLDGRLAYWEQRASGEVGGAVVPDGDAFVHGVVLGRTQTLR